MMKNRFLKIVFVVSILISSRAFAQSDSAPPELSLFRGGYADFGLTLNLNSIGSSLGSGSMGGVMSSRVNNGALNLHMNPALLADVEQLHVYFDSRLGVGSNMFSATTKSFINNLNDDLASSIDKEFSNEDSWNKLPDASIYPTKLRSLDVGLGKPINSIGFAAPIYPNLVLAASYYYPTQVNFNLAATGIVTKLGVEQGTDELSLRFDVLMNISLIAQSQLNISTLNAGFGYKLYDGDYGKFLLGATISRYEAENTRNLNADLSGVVVVGGADERYFNNPNDPNLNYEIGETNSFYMNANGVFRDSGIGYKIGLNYQPSKWTNLSVVYEHVPSFSMSSEDAIAEAYLPVFIAGTGDEILSGNATIALDSLDPSKPNLSTYRDLSKFTSSMNLNLPSSIKVGLDVGISQNSTFVLNYTHYLSELSLQIDDDLYGKDVKHGFGFGFDFAVKDRFDSWTQIFSIPIRLLFFDIDGVLFQSFRKYTNYSNPRYRFGAQFLFGEGLFPVKPNDANPKIDDNTSKRDLMGLPLPQAFSMGRQYTIFNHVDVGVTVFAFPDVGFKYSLAYRF